MSIHQRKKEFKAKLNTLCKKYHVVMEDRVPMVYRRGNRWDTTYVDINTHPRESVAAIGSKLLPQKV